MAECSVRALYLNAHALLELGRGAQRVHKTSIVEVVGLVSVGQDADTTRPKDAARPCGVELNGPGRELVQADGRVLACQQVAGMSRYSGEYVRKRLLV
jgi:hypothetical protein